MSLAEEIIRAGQGARQQALAEPSQQLAQIGALQGILSNQEMNPLKMALMQAQIKEHLQKVASGQQQQGLLAGILSGQGGQGGVPALQNPDTLRTLGLLMNKPEYITHAERVDAKAADAKSLAAMQAQPTGLAAGQVIPGTTQAPTRALAPDEAAAVAQIAQGRGIDTGQGMQATDNPPPVMSGGSLSPLFNSPYVGPQAQQLQKMVDSGQITAKDARAEESKLLSLHTSQTGSANRQQITIDNRREPQEPLVSVIDPTTKQPMLVPRSQANGMTPGNAAGVSAQGGMDAASIKVAAWEKLLFGTDPKGMGTASSVQRSEIAKERARIGEALGLSPQEIAMLPQDNKVKMKAVGNLTNWGAFVGKASEQLEKTLDLAIDYAKQLDPTTLQTLNKAIIAGKKEFNDPIANAYAVQVNTVKQEYGRLMSGPTSNAMLPVEAMKKGDQLISTALDVPAWNELKTVLIRDAKITQDSVNNQITGLKAGMVPAGKSKPTPPNFGEVRNGYRFQGGDPGKPENWEKM